MLKDTRILVEIISVPMLLFSFSRKLEIEAPSRDFNSQYYLEHVYAKSRDLLKVIDKGAGCVYHAVEEISSSSSC